MLSPPPVELGDQLIRLVKLLHAAKHYDPLRRPDVDPNSYAAMFLIWAGETRVSDLATRLHTDISTVSRQVTSLVERGLVARGPDPRDGRAQVLGITDDGKDLVVALRARRDAWLDAVLADWSHEDRTSVGTLLDRLCTDLEADLTARRAPHTADVKDCK